MARGGKRARRAKGVGLAQSGGRATTFQGTSGGGAYGSAFGGSKGQTVKGNGDLSNGGRYKVRGPGGDKTLTSGVGAKPKPANLHSLSGSGATPPTRRINKGNVRGAGGSS